MSLLIDSHQKLHLGCGEKYLNGFLNVDVRDAPNVDYVCDFIAMPFAPNSISEIYMCHSLEHLRMHDVVPFLKRCYAALTPGSKIYISVPDFAILASIYLSGRVSLSSIVRAVHGGQEYDGNFHYISFDSIFLRELLETSGFDRVEPYCPNDYLPKNYTDTSTYSIGGKPISLNICAQKL